LSSRAEEFHAFVGDQTSLLHRTAYLLCGDWYLAQDVVQDTLIKAYRHWTRVRRADNPDAYVRRMLVNEVRDRWRRRDKTVPVAYFPYEPAADDSADDIVRRERLRLALLELPAQQRATVVLRYLEGMSQGETAKILGCSEGTVKSQSSRGLSSLRAYLERTESSL
jgi:RNA polymerase sigma-70 factor (sigma-E family)